MARPADAAVLNDKERAFLERNKVRGHRTPRSQSDRCRMILLCAEGRTDKDVAERLGVIGRTVGKWRRRFVRDRIEGPTTHPVRVVRVSCPTTGSTRWSGGRSIRSLGTPPIGRCGPWRPRRVCRVPRSGAYGRRSGRTASHTDVQTVEGPPVQGKGAGRRGPVHVPPQRGYCHGPEVRQRFCRRVFKQNLLIDPMIFLAGLVQMQGFGFLLWILMKALMSASNSRTER